MKWALSGGHLTPALALIDYLQEQHPEEQIVFIGREFSREKAKQPSKERAEASTRGVPFIAFTSGKLNEESLVGILTMLWKLSSGVIQAFVILIREKPQVLVSFGSYVAVPLAFAAWVLHIPVITHEQTRTIGVANKVISLIARRVAVSYRETLAHLPKQKSKFTGNLLRHQLLNTKVPTPSWYSVRSDKPVLYITGGSQGSEVINTFVGRHVSRLVKDWVVIHQCGSSSAERSYKTELEDVRAGLSATTRSSYLIREWITVEELAWIYRKAACMVCRSGANTTQEIAVFQIPSILIPLPFAHNDEQQLNAEWLADTGGAVIVQQKDLSSDIIFQQLDLLREKNKAFRRKLASIELPLDAPELLYKLVKEVVS